MIGTYVWNLIIGGLSGLMAFSLAYINANTFVTSLVRGFISFVVMFMLTYLFRWLLALVIQDTQNDVDSDKEVPAGAKIDLQTPEEEINLADLLGTPSSPQRAEDKQDFEPFTPPRIQRVDEGVKQAASDPAIAAKAVRRLTED